MSRLCPVPLSFSVDKSWVVTHFLMLVQKCIKCVCWNHMEGTLRGMSFKSLIVIFPNISSQFKEKQRQNVFYQIFFKLLAYIIFYVKCFRIKWATYNKMLLKWCINISKIKLFFLKSFFRYFREEPILAPSPNLGYRPGVQVLLTMWQCTWWLPREIKRVIKWALW